MFNTKTATINADEFVSNYMSAGIHDNVTLKEVEIKKSTNGRDFLEITFQNASEQTASMTIWKNEKNQWIKTDEDLQKRDNAQFGTLMQIINCYYETIEDTTLNTFMDMITWVKSKLDPMIPIKKELRLKVVYDNKGFTKVSTLGIFVEPMTTEKSQIKKFAKDLFERPVQADVEKPSNPLTNPISIPVTATGGSEDTNNLPF